jgi:hypothetical protein
MLATSVLMAARGRKKIPVTRKVLKCARPTPCRSCLKGHTRIWPSTLYLSSQPQDLSPGKRNGHIIAKEKGRKRGNLCPRTAHQRSELYISSNKWLCCSIRSLIAAFSASWVIESKSSLLHGTPATFEC